MEELLEYGVVRDSDEVDTEEDVEAMLSTSCDEGVDRVVVEENAVVAADGGTGEGVTEDWTVSGE